MSDLLQEGLEWLGDQLKEHCSRLVVYRREDQQVAVKATLGKTLLQVDDGFGGARMEWTDRDFLILTGDLVLNDQPTLPEPGDRIRDVQGGQAVVFEVMAPGKEHAWRFADPFQKVLRIHTKFVGAEPI